jgi:hypothetical protein
MQYFYTQINASEKGSAHLQLVEVHLIERKSKICPKVHDGEVQLVIFTSTCLKCGEVQKKENYTTIKKLLRKSA